MKYKPMLAKIGKHTLLDDKTLIFEPKLDGYRALCEVSPNGMKFFSHNGHDITAQFPEFQFRKAINAKTCILDGEIIVDDKKGFPNFNLLQGRSQLSNPEEIAAHALRADLGETDICRSHQDVSPKNCALFATHV